MRAAAFIAIVLGAALLAGAGSMFGAFAVKAAACRMSTQPGTFLAYCEAPTFGDYEHGAYRYDTEPGIAGHMRAAQILFLGSSIAQVGFSTDATTAFFAAHPHPYYLLGFGYGEQGDFITDLVRRYALHPRMLVIDADPFFMEAVSAPAQLLRNRSPRKFVDIALRLAFDRIHPLLCRLPRLCTATEGSIYRIRKTGAWIWKHDWTPDLRVPVTAEKRYPLAETGYDPAIRAAAKMLPLFGVPRECIVLTGTPNSQVNVEEIATRLGAALGLPVLLAPPLDGLTTMDRHHLSPDSAERWSAAFLPLLEPVMQRCLRPD